MSMNPILSFLLDDDSHKTRKTLAEQNSFIVAFHFRNILNNLKNDNP